PADGGLLVPPQGVGHQGQVDFDGVAGLADSFAAAAVEEKTAVAIPNLQVNFRRTFTWLFKIGGAEGDGIGAIAVGQIPAQTVVAAPIVVPGFHQQAMNALLVVLASDTAVYTIR